MFEKIKDTMKIVKALNSSNNIEDSLQEILKPIMEDAEIKAVIILMDEKKEVTVELMKESVKCFTVSQLEKYKNDCIFAHNLKNQ
jgi:transcriptional regulator with GAF, ATPase, and Fis domain